MKQKCSVITDDTIQTFGLQRPCRCPAEQEMVNANKKLIQIFEQKIKDKISEVWGE